MKRRTPFPFTDGHETGATNIRTRIAVVAALLLANTGCSFLAYFKPAPAPIREVRFTKGGAPNQTLIVFLPGRYSDPAEFATERFTALAEEAGAAVDMMAVDAHIGYYAKRTINIRLKADVIDPAHAAGYRDIWLVGVSMGGLGALLYAREHSSDIAGMVLLAPFLGDKKVIDEIAAAGGLAYWSPTEPIPSSDYQRGIWRFLKESTVPGSMMPPIYLGYGTEDGFARADGLLGRELPEGHVVTVPGGHSWETWRPLWRKVLDSGAFPKRPAKESMASSNGLRRHIGRNPFGATETGPGR